MGLIVRTQTRKLVAICSSSTIALIKLTQNSVLYSLGHRIFQGVFLIMYLDVVYCIYSFF